MKPDCFLLELSDKTHKRGRFQFGFCSIEGSVSCEAKGKTMIPGVRNIRHHTSEKGKARLFWDRNQTSLVRLEVRCIFFLKETS